MTVRKAAVHATVAALLGAGLCYLVIVLTHGLATVVLVTILVLGCIGYFLADFWLLDVYRTWRLRRTGVEVTRGKFKKTRRDNTTVTEWSDGRRDVEVEAQAAHVSVFAGHATGTVSYPSWWKRALSKLGRSNLNEPHS
jgi:hypothetical protein